MNKQDLDSIDAALGPLMRALDLLAQVARFCHPGFIADLLTDRAKIEADLTQVQEDLASLPDHLSGIAEALDQSADAALDGLAELGQLPGEGEGVWAAYRALRHQPAALSALYPLAGILPEVNRYFLDLDVRDDAAAQQRFIPPPMLDNAGVMHVGDAPGEHGGFSLYVPEDYDPARRYPLVVALHGGSGNGSRFLWTWLRAARTHGAILACPTSTDATWSIGGDDIDTPLLEWVVEFVSEGWNIDPKRRLLTGMSDGGTFAWLTGLKAESPFTHLAPVATAFHPMFLQMADEQRLQDLPIYMVHGALDWMFPLEGARHMSEALIGLGADVTYREISDLSHCYPREENGPILAWMAKTAR